MLSLLLFLLNKRKNMLTIEEMAINIQQGNEEVLTDLIKSYKPFVKRTVSSVCKRYINDSDDEFSIGLMAFHEAIIKYEPDKGSSLLAFSEVVIRRKIIDYIRKNQREKMIRYDFLANSMDEDAVSSIIEKRQAMEAFNEEIVAEERRDEIVMFTVKLKEYGMSFQDIIEQAPKHEDARQTAMSIARQVAGNSEWMEHLSKKKRLPLKSLENHVSVSRKTMERNRKYIIAIALLLDGDFPHLQHYIKGRFEQ
ncbi:RNA polymerase sigma-I factor [Jeotgalibacillus soli]|uniref:RNA polymerase sigma factor SigI n=1 Tax=Jeotgalibacillus soli TaxID=889306 RepID=A0A0C2VA61_9BACL|nr:RNA polymerase sigma factor SigI [Jeotgalibacillus soli]